ncbi:MAG: hypothetical protein KIT07_11535, partial [Anaerolineales bacterium]|nr:hypothetical protein [Anaerolineales bacterium]
EFGRAVQAMLQAASEDPGNPIRHGNLGVAYYRNRQSVEAIDAFTLAIRGGMTETGVPVQGLPLQYGQVATFYYMYGLSLAREGRCAEALPISQALIAAVPDDLIAVSNAEEMVAICSGESS